MTSPVSRSLDRNAPRSICIDSQRCVRRIVLFTLLLVLAWSPPTRVQAQPFDANTYYQLTTQWRGDGYSLDIVNDGRANNRIILARTGDYTGQMWKMTPIDDAPAPVETISSIAQDAFTFECRPSVTEVRVNECDNPGDDAVARAYRGVFHPACQKHDACYSSP